MQDDALDRLLADAALIPPTPSPELMSRVLADALALQPVLPSFSHLAKHAPRSGTFARLVGLFGGAHGLAAMTAVAILGIAIGYLNPSSMDGLASSFGDSGTEEFFPSVDFLTDEG